MPKMTRREATRIVRGILLQSISSELGEIPMNVEDAELLDRIEDFGIKEFGEIAGREADRIARLFGHQDLHSRSPV